MFSSLAWLRAFAFALLVLSPSTSAREETIFTSSVTYCNPPETLLISRFEVAYFPQNSSVAFNVSAASVQPNVSVTANLFVNVYGMKPLNLTLDLCNILGGALCPLPMYNFTGADSLSLPDSLGINGRIPSIAFSIPDLEGFAQLTLTEVGTGNIKACVQATLANGWSAHQEAVEWTTGGLAIFAFLAALLVSFLSKDAQNVTPFRFLDLISLFQAIASSALLSLNYPSVYRAFALNFAWALGLFPTQENGAIQSSINKMRHRTGGRLADAAQGSAVQFVNRKLSPYNDNLLAIGGLPLPSISTTNSDLLTRQLEPAQQMVPNLARRFVNLVQREGTVTGEVKTVTNSSANVLQAGLPIYVNSLHVATGNAFMTVFLVALMMFAIGLAVLALGYGVYVLVRRRRRTTKDGFVYLAFSRSWVLRLSLIALFPLLIFIFNQWTLKDSWASILLSVLALVALILLIGYPSFTTLRLAHTRSPFELYTPAHPHLQAAGPLYAQYRVPRYYFYFCAPLVGTVLRAVFIAFAQSNDTAQIALMVALEVCLVAVHLVLRPHPSRGGDVFSTFVAVVRMLAAGLSIAFLQGLDVKPIPRVVIGFVMVVVFGVAVIVVVVNFLVNLVAVCLPRRKGGGGEKDGGGDGGEKGLKDGSWSSSGGSSTLDSNEKEGGLGLVLQASSSEGHGDGQRAVRPHNPTPEASSPVENGTVLASFPISPTGTTVTSVGPPSPYTGYSRDSASLTVGSLLPRRWSESFGYETGTDEGYEGRYAGEGSSEGYFGSPSAGGSRRGSESVPGSPAWRSRPGSSGGSSSAHGGLGLGRKGSSSRGLQGMQVQERIVEDEAA